MSKTASTGPVKGKKCQLTGKRQTRGNTYAIRGIAKKKKGIGLKITGKTRRSFKPNIHKKRFWLPDEKRFVTLKLSAAAIRTIEKRGILPVVREMRANGQKI
ncbi:MAG: 50S ribosomal protein L28 [Chlamydiia bacterium]|nr:50S ribosomal protein L28 [Chlamydiia bacterium]